MSSEPCLISPDSTTVDLSLHEILVGRIVIVTGWLRRQGMLEVVRRETFGALADAASPDTAQEVEHRGLERLHTVVTPAQASATRTILETRLRPIATRIALAFATSLSRQRSAVYLGHHSGIRIMLPEQTIVTHRAAFEELTGFMVPHDLHRDSWYNTGVNSINLWMAISRVRKGNGLLVFPDAYRPGPRRHSVLATSPTDVAEPVGEPMRFDMEPGDILLFAGDHLHSSEPNTTDETRYVLTKRLSLGAPRYNPRGSGWVPYYDTRLFGTALQPLASLRSRASAGYARNLARTVRSRFIGTRAG
jgi:ectoine hydroxylase-related dioxygenase (phytanoyl-CoA dioxygenase family)